VATFDVDPWALEVARALREAGGRGLLVGGWVRDRLLGRASKDYDFEVFGLPLERLASVLGAFGELIQIGRSFGVLRVKGREIDFSIPRRDSKAGRGHRGFRVELDPTLDFATAALRRDLTINSMAYDPLTGEILDPHGGRADLERRTLRATDPTKFAEDSLRGLRVAQFLARFEMRPDAELRLLCAGLDLSDLAGERIHGELTKLVLGGARPAQGFEFLRETGLLRIFPELVATVDTPQDPEWHPEGTVWKHTLLVVDEAAALRTGEVDDDLALGFGALLHDVGKPATTVESAGRIVSPGHEAAGVPLARSFLARIRASTALGDRVCAIVRHHLAPLRLVREGATPKAYRRLARRLAAAGLAARLLCRAARADHFGRATAEARARRFPEADEFLRRMEALDVADRAPRDVVLGRHLIERGFTPGPAIGRLLRACRDVQDETGWDDPERILQRVLSEERKSDPHAE
jgi:tRNA nucleotidyltransferase (CCA-adding enzyme)